MGGRMGKALNCNRDEKRRVDARLHYIAEYSELLHPRVTQLIAELVNGKFSLTWHRNAYRA